MIYTNSTSINHTFTHINQVNTHHCFHNSKLRSWSRSITSKSNTYPLLLGRFPELCQGECEDATKCKIELLPMLPKTITTTHTYQTEVQKNKMNNINTVVPARIVPTTKYIYKVRICESLGFRKNDINT